MARTKASVGAKVSSGKSSKARCSVAPPSNSSSSSGSSNRSAHSSSGGGNPMCNQPTPKWQRAITYFFISKDPVCRDDDDEAGTSKAKRRNIIESDDEDTETPPPRNSELDESIELAPLTGEKSHKIEEYYQRNGEKQQNEEDANESLDVKETEQKNVTVTNENQSHNENGISDSINGENLPKNRDKGKGRGKKTNKENFSTNVKSVDRKLLKRDFEDISGECSSISKKVRVH